MANKLKVKDPVAGRPSVDIASDRMAQSDLLDYIGQAKDPAAVVRVAITAAYQDAFSLQASDAVLDLNNYDSIFAVVDYVKSAGTDLRLKFTAGEVDDRTKLSYQEMRDDNGFTGVVKHEVVEHVFSATGRYLIAIPRLTRYSKIEAKSSGAPDANDKVAIAVFGQNGV